MGHATSNPFINWSKNVSWVGFTAMAKIDLLINWVENINPNPVWKSKRSIQTQNYEDWLNWGASSECRYWVGSGSHDQQTLTV